MGFITSFIVYKTNKHDNKKLDKFNFIQYKEENTNKYLVNPKNVFEVYYVLLLILISEFKTSKGYSVKTEKRAKKVIIVASVIALIILLLALILASIVVYPECSI